MNISRLVPADDNPMNNLVLKKFLDFLAQDIQQNLATLNPISSDLVKRVHALVSDVEIDLNAPLSDEDE